MNCDIWDFLDKMDKNLLYTYTSKLTNGGHSRGYYIPSTTGNAECDELFDAEAKRKLAYYLIWFVYRYVLNCKTYEESLKYANLDVLKRYKLMPLFTNHPRPYVYVGMYGIKTKYFRSPEQDIKSILYILYNRCDYIEQIEVYINNTPSDQLSKIGRGKKLLKESIRLMESYKKPSLQEMLNKYYERCNDKSEKKKRKCAS